MHLKIAVGFLSLAGCIAKDGLRLCPTKKILSDGGRIGNGWRTVQPSADNFFEIRSDAWQFRERATFAMQLTGFAGPKESFSRGAAEGFLQGLRGGLRLGRKEFRDFRSCRRRGCGVVG